MDATVTPPTNAPVPKTHAIEQYKAYLQDLGNIGTRFSTANGFFLSLITALLGILALTKPGESLMDLKTILRLIVPSFAILICWLWSREIRSYKEIFKVKFQVLRELELDGGLFPTFGREDKLFAGGPAGWLLENEGRIPRLLALPFLFILAYTLYKLVW